MTCRQWTIVAAILGSALITGCKGGGQSDSPATSPPAGKATAASNVLDVPAPGGAVPFGDARYITSWSVLGPFGFEESDFGGDQQQQALDKEFVPDESALDGTRPAPAGATWQTKNFQGSDEAGKIDLDSLYGMPEHAAAYAVATVVSPRDIPNAKLMVGSDDYIRVWLNGKLVHTYNTERRAGSPDQDVVTVAIRQGPNRLVVKCVDVVFDWNFYLRFATAEGQAIGVKTP